MDRDVVERARSGDQEAFADLVHQISDTLLGVARRTLRDPTLAEDVLQNALVTIWRKLPHLREADRFEGWAFRILVHACYADAPRNRRWVSAIRVLHADVASDIDDIQKIADRDELEQAFHRLPLDPFPTEAFAALSDDPVPEDVAAKFQAILADMAGGGGDCSHRDHPPWNVERRRGQGGQRS